MSILTPDQLLLAGINVLLAWSVYVVMLSGAISFAQVSFSAIGAYASGILSTRYGVPVAGAVAFGIVAASLAAAIIGYPALRARGLFLILVTIGLVFIVRVSLENIKFLGGVQGLTGMKGIEPAHVFAAVFVVGALLFMLSRSSLQRILDAVREDERIAASLGINATYVRMIAFVAGAALAGLTGALYAHYIIFISPDSFDILWSVFVVFYVILGGVNNMWGPVFGAVLLTLLPELFQDVAPWRPTLFGIAILIILALRPDGVLAFRQATARAGRHRGK
jgi:branched-chain amino acid transport system permease protein